MPSPSIITDIYDNRARVTFRPGPHTYSIRVHGHVDKLFQPSITGILGLKAKPALISWAAKQSLLHVAKNLGKFESEQGMPPFMIDTKHVHGWLAEAQDGWRDDETATTVGHVAHSYAYEELRYRAKLTPNKPRFPLVADSVLMPSFTPAMVDAANSSALAATQFFDEHHFEPFLMERPLWSPVDGFVGTPDYIGMIDGELAIADYKTSRKIYVEYWAQLAALQYMFQMEFPGKVIKKRYAINIPKDGGDVQVETRGLDTFGDDLEMFMACWTLYRWERANDDYKKGSPVQVLGDLDALIARPA